MNRLRYLAHLTRFQLGLLAFGLAGLVVAQVNQPFPSVAPLHHLPTLLLLIALPAILKRWTISDAGLLCLFVFFALHTIGGRYTYTNTPYDAWFELIFGEGLNAMMGWERNHYDRFVHFSFGLLFVAPVAELLRRYSHIGRGLSLYIGVEFILAVSALYEVFEWWLSIVMAPDNVEAYNGQQGDIWDPQKDMGLAFLGALLAMAWLLWRPAKNDPIGKGEP